MLHNMGWVNYIPKTLDGLVRVNTRLVLISSERYWVLALYIQCKLEVQGAEKSN